MEERDKMLKYAGRIIAGAYYDYQEVRKSMMNRIRDIVRKKAEGIPFDAVEEKQDNKNYDKKYSDGKLPETLVLIKDKLSDKEYDYMTKILSLVKEAMKMENQYKKVMQEYIYSEIIYQEFLQHIKGISIVLSANLIKEFGYCEKYKYVSSLWKHCGFDVQDGVAPRREAGKRITYNPRLRTLGWQIADSLVKQRSPLYRELYDREKQRQLEKEYPKGYLAEKYNPKNNEKKLYNEDDTHIKQWHAHARAMRYIAKMFLEHYFVASKELTGQEVTKAWIIEHGGHKDYISWKNAVEANLKAKRSLNKKKRKVKKNES